MLKEYPYQNLSISNIPNEEWRDVVGFEGLYSVSNMGRVKSIAEKDCAGRKMTPFVKKQTICNSNGYLFVHLQNGFIKKIATVHSIVAAAFLGEKGDNLEVDHIDTDRKNNVVSNLRLCTRSENMRNQITNERCRQSSKKRSETESEKSFLQNISKLGHTEEAHAKRRKTFSERMDSYSFNCLGVVQYDLNMNKIAEYKSISDAERKNGISHISMCCSGKRKTAGGFIWKYKN